MDDTFVVVSVQVNLSRYYAGRLVRRKSQADIHQHIFAFDDFPRKFKYRWVRCKQIPPDEFSPWCSRKELPGEAAMS